MGFILIFVFQAPDSSSWPRVPVQYVYTVRIESAHFR
jgi:hypothetical protein